MRSVDLPRVSSSSGLFWCISICDLDISTFGVSLVVFVYQRDCKTERFVAIMTIGDST